ncbi:MAG: hypothetical protein ACO24Y_05880 [Hylemonella sp.]
MTKAFPSRYSVVGQTKASGFRTGLGAIRILGTMAFVAWSAATLGQGQPETPISSDRSSVAAELPLDELQPYVQSPAAVDMGDQEGSYAKDLEATKDLNEEMEPTAAGASAAPGNPATPSSEEVERERSSEAPPLP